MRAIGAAYRQLGTAAIDQGDLALARESLWRGLESARDLRLFRHEIHALIPLAVATRLTGDVGGGRSLLEQALAVARDARNLSQIGSVWLNLGYHDWVVGDLAAMAADVVQGLTLFRDIEVVDHWDSWLLGDGIALAGVLALERGDVRRGARLLGTAERYGFRPAGRYPDERARYAVVVQAARGNLGDEAFAVASAEGQAMTLEEAISYALDEDGA